MKKFSLVLMLITIVLLLITIVLLLMTIFIMFRDTHKKEEIGTLYGEIPCKVLTIDSTHKLISIVGIDTGEKYFPRPITLDCNHVIDDQKIYKTVYRSKSEPPDSPRMKFEDIKLGSHIKVAVDGKEMDKVKENINTDKHIVIRIEQLELLVPNESQ